MVITSAQPLLNTKYTSLLFCTKLVNWKSWLWVTSLVQKSERVWNKYHSDLCVLCLHALEYVN